MYTRGFEFGWNHRLHTIARFKAAHEFVSHQLAIWEALLGEVGAAMLPPSGRNDLERVQFADFHFRHLPDGQGIQRMSLFQAQTRTIPAGTPAAPGANRKPKTAQFLHQFVAGRVHLEKVVNPGRRRGKLRRRLLVP